MGPGSKKHGQLPQSVTLFGLQAIANLLTPIVDTLRAGLTGNAMALM